MMTQRPQSINNQREFAKLWYLTLALVALRVPTADAQSTNGYGLVDGLVTNQSLAPLDDATVSILGSKVKVVTGQSGRFQILRLPAGQHVVIVRRLGYQPVSASITVTARDTARVSFTLEHVVALDTVVVLTTPTAAGLAAFESRRRFGFGHFLTQEDIEGKKATFVADLLRSVLSLRIEERGRGQYAFNTRGDCRFQLFLDGVLLPQATDLNDLPPPYELAGIEIYSGPATIPLQYKRSDAGCGVILFWTRTGAKES